MLRTEIDRHVAYTLPLLHPVSCTTLMPCYPCNPRPYTYTIGAGALACILLLFWALSRTAPSYFSAQQAPNTPLQCKALDDAGKARILGSQNQVVYHAIATHSQDAQTLFSLGLLHAYGGCLLPPQGEVAMLKCRRHKLPVHASQVCWAYVGRAWFRPSAGYMT